MPNPRQTVSSSAAVTSRAAVSSSAAVTSRAPCAGSSPLSLSGLLGWWNAESGITLNGSNVATWNDLSGNGFHVTAPTVPQQPAYTASSATFNNLPCVTGDGITTVLSCASNVWPTTNVTVVAVLATTTGGNTGEFFSCFQGGGEAALHFYGSSETEFKRNSTGPTKTLTAGVQQIVTYTVSGSGAGSIENMYLNGGNVNTVRNAAPAIGNRNLYIFGASNVPVFPRKYPLAKLAIFGRVLTNDERINFEYYLSLIQNITLA